MALQVTKYKVLKILRAPGKKHEVNSTLELTDKKTIDALIKAGAIEPAQTKEETK